MDTTHCCKLLEVIWDQQKEGSFCDAILQAEGQNIWVHKCILSANSAFFSNIFSASCPSNSPQELPFPEAKAKHIKIVVEYMYTGVIQVMSENVENILMYAQKFCIEPLTAICERFLLNHLDTENWFSVFQLASSFSLVNVKNAITRFVGINGDLLLQKDSSESKTADRLKILLSNLPTCNLTPEEKQSMLKDAISSSTDSIAESKLYLQQIRGILRSEGILNSVDKVQWHEEDSAAEVQDVHREEVPPADGEIGPEEHVSVGKSSENRAECHLGDVYDNSSNSYVTRIIENSSINLRKRKPITYDQGDNESENSEVHTRYKRKRKSSNPKRLGIDRVNISKMKRTKFQKGSTSKLGKDSNWTPQARHSSRKKERISNLNKEKNQDVPVKDEDKADNRKIAPESGDKTEKDIIYCSRCSEEFSSQNAFKNHMKEHGASQPFSCDFCVFETKHYGIFLSHVKRVHRDGKEKINCAKCSKTFPTVSALSHHMRGHGTDVPLLCHVCGYTTRHFASMSLHRRLHNGRHYACTYEGCTYITPRKTRFEDHVNKHEGVKNYVCAQCGKAFGAKKHLLRHENIHKEDKIIQCEECEYSSSRHDKIRHHIRKHHPRLACAKGFITEEEADRLIAMADSPPVGQRKASTSKTPRKKKTPAASSSGEQEAARAQSPPAGHFSSADPTGADNISAIGPPAPGVYPGVCPPGHLQMGVTRMVGPEGEAYSYVTPVHGEANSGAQNLTQYAPVVIQAPLDYHHSSY